MKRLVAILCLAIAAVSCEKIIEIDLREADSVVVIQGNLEKDSVCVVTVSRTIAFAEPNNFPVIRDAEVTLLDNDSGVTENLLPNTAGEYRSSTILGEEKHHYTLTVKLDDSTYIAHSVMPELVVLDSARYHEALPLGKEVALRIFTYYQNPVAARSYFKFDVTINDELDHQINLRNGRYTSGQYIDQPFMVPTKLKPQKVEVAMYCIDEAAYDFYRTLRGNAGSSAPANPLSNFSGDCVGYFKAYTKQSVTAKLGWNR